MECPVYSALNIFGIMFDISSFKHLKNKDLTPIVVPKNPFLVDDKYRKLLVTEKSTSPTATAISTLSSPDASDLKLLDKPKVSLSNVTKTIFASFCLRHPSRVHSHA